MKEKRRRMIKSEDKDLKTLIWESEKKQQIIKEVDRLLTEWQDLSAEQQSKRLNFLLGSLALLDSKDQKLCVEKLSQGGIVSKREAIRIINETAEALGVEDDIENKDSPIYTSFLLLPDGAIAEMLYDITQNPPTFFAVYNQEGIDYKQKVKIGNAIYLPYPPNDLLRNGVVYLPSECEEYGDESLLLQEIKQFIHKYLDVGDFEDIAVYYVLFTWVYDRFTVVPYLRTIGREEGIGKSRFLQTIGVLCYKPIFCGGATTPSPIFRMIEMFKGTLIIDEADFKLSSDVTDIVKILNCGFMKGIPVLRNEQLGKNFIPRSYDVYCPKILASKREFQDKNLESRFLIKEMESTEREDIPIILPKEFWQEAQSIRNKLLRWRFRKYSQIKEDLTKVDRSLEHRLNQIIVPLLSIISDEKLSQQIKSIVSNYHREIGILRGMGLEGDVLKVVDNLWSIDTKDSLSIGNITEEVNRALSEKEKITPHRLGKLVRGLKFKIKQIRGHYYIEYNEANRKRLERLLLRYGLKEG